MTPTTDGAFAPRARHRLRVVWRRAAANPVAVVAVAGFVLWAGLVLVGSTQVGISTDAPVHQSRMNVWFDTGWYVPERFFDDSGQPDPEVEIGRWHTYGAGFSAYGHAVAVLAGVEDPGVTSRSAAAYAVRGVAVALLGIAAAAAVGFATAVVAGSRLAGWWAAAATMVMPLWAGYSMFAVKDVPAAAGWTFVTAGLVVALHRSPGRGRQVVVVVLCAAGVWFSVGVRTALWVPIVLGVLGFGMLAAARWPVVRGNVVAVAAGLVGGFVAVAALQYRNAATPVTWLLSAVRTSGDFEWIGTTLTAGRLLPEKPPWWYLPAWVGGTVPLLLGALAVAGIVVAAVTVLRLSGSGGRVRGRLGSADAAMSLWGVQALLLPTVATVGGATMYAGLRQHLYVLPALAAFAGYAAARLLRRWGDRWFGPAALVLALVLPAVEQLPLFPYQYVYKNVAAGPINDRWETDMHFVAGREALTRVPAGTEAFCYTTVFNPQRVRGCRPHRQIRPFAGEQGSRARVAANGGEVWVIGRKYRGSQAPDQCVDAGSVTRRLRGEDVVLALVLTCPSTIRGGS